MPQMGFGVFCAEQGTCSAGLRQTPEPGCRSGTGAGMAGTWHWDHQASPSKVLRVRRQVGAYLEPWFVGPGLLHSPHIYFGGMKRVPGLPLPSRALCGASQFSKDAEWQLSFEFTYCGYSTASCHCSCQLLWCDAPQTSCVPVWHRIGGEKNQPGPLCEVLYYSKKEEGKLKTSYSLFFFFYYREK